MRLAHVRGQVWANNEEPPDWVGDVTTNENGVMKLIGLDDHVMVQFTAKVVRGQIAIDIALQGLYEVSEASSVLLPRDEDEHRWMVQRIPEEYRPAVIEQATLDL